MPDIRFFGKISNHLFLFFSFNEFNCIKIVFTHKKLIFVTVVPYPNNIMFRHNIRRQILGNEYPRFPNFISAAFKQQPHVLTRWVL